MAITLPAERASGGRFSPYGKRYVPEPGYLRDSGRARCFAVAGGVALAAFQLASRPENIIPALETARAFAWLDQSRGRIPEDIVILGLSGWFGKHVEQVAALPGRSA